MYMVTGVYLKLPLKLFRQSLKTKSMLETI
jgi:hypothetical protein